MTPGNPASKWLMFMPFLWEYKLMPIPNKDAVACIIVIVTVSFDIIFRSCSDCLFIALGHFSGRLSLTRDCQINDFFAGYHAMTMKKGQAGGCIGVARILLDAKVAHPASASAVKLAVSLTALAGHAQTSLIMLEFESLNFLSIL